MTHNRSRAVSFSFVNSLLERQTLRCVVTEQRVGRTVQLDDAGAARRIRRSVGASCQYIWMPTVMPQCAFRGLRLFPHPFVISLASNE
jgi:hypothetical protein